MDELPDDLLISIVSRLPVKEAGRTSVLSRRWRNIWNFSRILNFDGSEIIDANPGRFARLLFNSADRSVEWVKRVLSLHCGKTIDEFIAGFNLDKFYGNEIDRWIEFALRKRVQKLELDFQSRPTDKIFDTSEYHRNGEYIFPNVTKYNLPYSLSLISLSLTNICLPQDVLDSFMSNCPTLEHLHLQLVRGFTVFRPSFRLSSLALIHCLDLERIETTTNSNRVSSLIHLILGEPLIGSKLLGRLDELSSVCLSRLETLTLHGCGWGISRWSTICQSLPRVKKLVLEIQTFGFKKDGVIDLVAVIMNAAPLLEEINLKAVDIYMTRRRRRRRPLMGRQKHTSLKVLEVEGFYEVALYVLENTTALEKLIMDGVAATTAQDLHRLNINLLQRF